MIMLFAIDEITSSDIDGLIELLEYERDEIKKYELKDIVQSIGATNKSLQLGLLLELLTNEENKYHIKKKEDVFFQYEHSIINQRREIIFRIARHNTNFLSAVLLCSPRGIKFGGSKRITQILSYAELTLPLNASSERWWLELRWFLRKVNSVDIEKFGNIGDLGELLSMSYEKTRLNERSGIERVSVIDGDQRGFDILSFTGKNSSERKRIEVKASTQNSDYAEIYLTWNEWKTAKLFGTHEFQLWPNIYSSPSKPIIISVESLSRFVPKTHKNVEWSSIKIPMSILLEFDTEGDY